MTEPLPLSPEELAQVDEWLRDWRAGMFTPANWARLEGSGPWPVEMVGLAETVDRLTATVRAAWEREQALRGALDFYADPLNYDSEGRIWQDTGGVPGLEPEEDMGHVAQHVLEALPADRQEQT